MSRETVIEAVEEGVVLLTMNRPRQKNAFNVQMWLEMAAAFSDARANPDVRAACFETLPER